MNIFDYINFAIKNTEASFVNLLSSVAPWAAPLAPAYMSFSHMKDSLDFPVWIAWAIAIMVEILGLSTVSTGMTFWNHNKRYTAKYKQAPVGLVIAIFIFYLSTIFLINIVLDLADPTNKLVYSLAKGSLILLNIPAALLIAMRTQHTAILNEIHEENNEKKKEKLSHNFRENYTNYPHDLPINVTDWRKLSKLLTEEHTEWILNTDANIVASVFGITKKTVYNWRRNL